MQAKDVMSTPVISVSPETLVSEVAALLADRRISGVPVLERGQVVGVVNEMDLLHRHEIGTEQVPAVASWLVQLFRADPAPSHYVKSHAARASDVMTRTRVSVDENTPLAEVAALFDSRGTRRVPVVRAGRVIGIITRADLVRVLAASATRPPVSTDSDDEIRAALLAELAAQRWWRPDWSTVTVTDGVVHFYGLVDSQDEKGAARVAAENVAGVRGVEDHRQRHFDVTLGL